MFKATVFVIAAIAASSLACAVALDVHSCDGISSVCAASFVPVCSTDGRTYAGACQAQTEFCSKHKVPKGVHPIATVSKAGAKCPLNFPNKKWQDVCQNGKKLKRPNGVNKVIYNMVELDCDKTPPPDFCPTIFRPVCASNCKEYSNMCEARRQYHQQGGKGSLLVGESVNEHAGCIDFPVTAVQPRLLRE